MEGITHLDLIHMAKVASSVQAQLASGLIEGMPQEWQRLEIAKARAEQAKKLCAALEKSSSYVSLWVP